MLSIGANRKLGKDVALFNLPSHKCCPGATPECKKICYAQKAERIYPSARKSRENNYKSSKKDNFVEMIIKELEDNDVKISRIHESGDFYDQKYLNKWIEITRALPKIKFLAFTKSFHLDFSGFGDNVAIYYSVDSTSNHDAIPKDRNQAITIGEINDLPKGSHFCGPVGKDKKDPKKKDEAHYNYCGDKCKFCWNNRDKNVYWLKH